MYIHLTTRSGMGQIIYKDVLFEWDDEKASNPGKHSGVTFDEALEVFFDPGLRFEDASRDGQARDTVIWLWREAPNFVCCER